MEQPALGICMQKVGDDVAIPANLHHVAGSACSACVMHGLLSFRLGGRKAARLLGYKRAALTA